MITASPTIPTFERSFFQALKNIILPNHKLPETSPDPDGTRARRDFLLDMLEKNPGAMQSEQDVQTLARLYRSKF